MRIVVAGNGMAGTRLASLLVGHDVTVFGAEPHPAYNRVLLSELLAGRRTEVRLAAPPADVRIGVSVLAVDRARRQVVDSEGGRTGYDALVLATGSRAWVPPGIPDLAGVTAFRTLDDCRAIIEAARTARHAVVLGGGLLGLEAARGLAARGLPVTLVHPWPHLMERQLDAAAGQVLARGLARLGVRILLNTTVTSAYGVGRFRGLILGNGSRLEGDLLVVACGVRPEVGLARQAALAVGRGVIVDDAMRSVTDPRIWAIGECAEHDGQVYGLVAPAWEQAAVAAARITGSAARYRGSRLVTRLKADGIELAAMGESLADPLGDDPGLEVVSFCDPARGTYKKLVLRDGRLAGALLLGDIGTVGLVTQLYDRGRPVYDRQSLLFGSPAPAQDDEICRCNGVTSSQIRGSYDEGARDLPSIARKTRATTGCGGCGDRIAALLASWSAQAA
ncbi:FAD-dependent oxidoreductase [Nonomuraea sediminis]|uniref:FAD-dependent oxidoreductase n=1 Tax=Nonomuraea sediminis TaxID=2835864 RepID=UPI001BDCC9F8|nr:FAD-dependent oxidoreductase [Nonomuraea sediminis]